jgi:D-3-phosphoglycerate dehydrogenase
MADSLIRILANDGLEPSAIELLTAHGIEVRTQKIAQENLADYIVQEKISGLLVRSATQVRKELIDACPELRFIGRGGVGLDNIDVAYAKQCGRMVTNTPAASSDSVAELVFAHLFSLARFLHHANRVMPATGNTAFSALKKQYAGATELRGKTLGIIGFGRIGQATAKVAMGLGMHVLPYDPMVGKAEIELDLFHTGDTISVEYETVSLERVFEESHMITLHVPMPANGQALISEREIAKMRHGVLLVNTARGGIIDETALLEGLNSGKIGGAGLDVFENEPSPNPALLNHERVSCSPHVGGNTLEAQERIGEEMARYILAFFGK